MDRILSRTKNTQSKQSISLNTVLRCQSSIVLIDSGRDHRLRENPKKCLVGGVEVRYLSHGQVHTQNDKTAAMKVCPRPKTKKRVKQFMSMTGYFWRFVPNLSNLTTLLTDLMLIVNESHN